MEKEEEKELENEEAKGVRKERRAAECAPYRKAEGVAVSGRVGESESRGKRKEGRRGETPGEPAAETAGATCGSNGGRALRSYLLLESFFWSFLGSALGGAAEPGGGAATLS